MSTLKANAINNISASVGGITIDSSGTVSGSLPSPNRNLLYNGAMQIHQRSTSVTGITTGDYRTVDRWFQQVFSCGTWSSTVEADAPTGSGFSKSLRMTCSASASPSGFANVRIWQKLEGQDLQRIAKGTASAKKLTMSFWVKSNVTGTYVAAIDDLTNSRYIAQSYTINSANVWERKIVSFVGDTSGVLSNNSSESLMPQFWLSSGSGFSGGSSLLTSWGTAGGNNLAVGQVNVASSVNNYFQITGVQLETGDPTEFEFKSFGQDLRECQRYFHRFFSLSSGGQVIGFAPLGYSVALVMIGRPPVSMRTNDGLGTLVLSNTAANAFRYFGGSGWTNVASVTPSAQNNQLVVQMSVDSPPSSGLVRIYDNNSGSPITFDANAEL